MRFFPKVVASDLDTEFDGRTRRQQYKGRRVALNEAVPSLAWYHISLLVDPFYNCQDCYKSLFLFVNEKLYQTRISIE